MSGDWLARLLELNETQYRPHHERTSPDYPACEVFDIDAVERAFVRTAIYQRFATLGCTSAELALGEGATCAARLPVARVIGSISIMDPVLNGSFCSAYNAQTRATRDARSLSKLAEHGFLLNGRDALNAPGK